LVRSLGNTLLREVRRYRPDYVWIDQGILFPAKTLITVKEIHPCLLVHFTPDSLNAPGMGLRLFRNALPEYDVCFAIFRKDELDKYNKLGAKKVFFLLKGYDPQIHRPVKLSVERDDRFFGDIVFVGQYMSYRAKLIENLVKKINCRIHLYGRGWTQGPTGSTLGPLERGWVYGDDYAKAISGAKIALCFLNREAGDEYTSRSFEIPACGTMMLAERTEAHLSLYEEDREAVYFETAEELLDKVRYYLAHDETRRRIAEAGYRRATGSGYTWRDRMAECLRLLKK
jgi:spore maturation protein CgeB